MADTTLKTRFKHPYRSLADWSLSTAILLPGEVAYTDDGRYKVGDGTKTFSQLDWPPVNEHSHSQADLIKFGTKAYWQEHRDYVPARGELIIVTDYEEDTNGDDIPAIKVGDGSAYGIDLPIVSKDLKNLIDQHIADNDRHVNDGERIFWNNKWRGYLSEQTPENLVFTIN